MSDKASRNVLTPIFRVSYPKVFKAEYNKLSQKEEFSVVALFKKGENLDAMKAAAAAACVDKFGPDQTKWPKGLKTPFRDQADKEKEGQMPAGHEKGAIFMTFKSTQQPAIRDAQNINYITEPSKFYPGCWARASVFAQAYSVNGGVGVTFYLNNLQFARDGEQFSGRPAPEEAFAPIEGAGTETATSLF